MYYVTRSVGKFDVDMCVYYVTFDVDMCVCYVTFDVDMCVYYVTFDEDTCVYHVTRGNFDVAKTHRIPYLYRSFSAKVTCIWCLSCGK